METTKTRMKIVKRVEAMQNQAQSSCSYTVPSEEIYRILTQGEERGESLIGFYHSHPFWGAEPSKLDLELASFPEISYLTYSARDHLLQSYNWTGRRFRRERIQVTKRKITDSDAIVQQRERRLNAS